MIVEVVLKVDFAGDIANRCFVGSGEPGLIMMISVEYVAAIFAKCQRVWLNYRLLT